MPTIRKHKVAVNPGRRKRRKRNLSLKQLLHFGTKKQRASAKSSLKRKRTRAKANPTRRRRRKNVVYAGRISTGVYRYTGKATGRKRKKAVSRKRRRRNVSSILRVLPNPGRKRRTKRMARKVSRRRRRRAVNVGHRRRRVYAVRRRRHVAHRRRRVGNPGRRRHYSRRRNPGMLSGGVGRVAGVIGGATLTGLLAGMVPNSLMSSQFISYFAIGAIAMLQGKLVAKVTKSSALGGDFAIGGYTFLALKIIKDFMPGLLPSLSIGLNGMGLIAPSNFYVPQVNRGGSMGSFVTPAGTPVIAAPASGMHGVRRTGRVR